MLPDTSLSEQRLDRVRGPRAALAPAASRRSAAVHQPDHRFPDFYIVGHGKCGTTALYRMMVGHPQIHMPVKEPRFFAPELRTRFWRPASSKRKHPRTLEGYLSLFTAAQSDQLVGEASPQYLRSTLAASHIAAVRPDARIVAILREPASLLRSVHLQALRNYDETQKDFRKAIALEDTRRQGRNIPRFSQVPSVLLYSEIVRYVQQLRRYHAVFPRDQVLVLIYDDFRSDNAGTVRQVLRFLGVDDEFVAPEVELESLLTPRYVLLDQLARAWSIARRSKAIRPLHRRSTALIPRSLRTSEKHRELWRKVRFQESPPVDEEVMLQLRRQFKAEVESVSEYLGRDLVHLWGYDKIV